MPLHWQKFRIKILNKTKHALNLKDTVNLLLLTSLNLQNVEGHHLLKTFLSYGMRLVCENQLEWKKSLEVFERNYFLF